MHSRSSVSLIVLTMMAGTSSVAADVIGAVSGVADPIMSSITGDLNSRGYEFEYVPGDEVNIRYSFLSNSPGAIGLVEGYQSVHFAVTALGLEYSEILDYADQYEPNFGKLIQVPLAVSGVGVGFNNGDVSAQNPLTVTADDVANIFSGQITNWNQLGNYPSKQIMVVYSNVDSGMTKIATRHLAYKAPHLFQENEDFMLARIGTPSGSALFLPVNGDQSVISVMNNIDGAIAFVGPNYPGFNDQTKVARIINDYDGIGYLPSETRVEATIQGISVPSTSNIQDWSPIFPDPTLGYPMAGLVFILASQCYEDLDVGLEVQDLLFVIGLGDYDGIVSQNNMIPITQDWALGALYEFSFHINDPDICQGLGR
ncbi:PstS family phosphate ABC transporter substrate-binding protein [Isoalcanivorax pacificus]|nr:substrate-binding domain-containing protein [Isoalcanivorax pacificus]